jgi:hypothetical protein
MNTQCLTSNAQLSSAVAKALADTRARCRECKYDGKRAACPDLENWQALQIGRSDADGWASRPYQRPAIAKRRTNRSSPRSRRDKAEPRNMLSTKRTPQLSSALRMAWEFDGHGAPGEKMSSLLPCRQY